MYIYIYIYMCVYIYIYINTPSLWFVVVCCRFTEFDEVIMAKDLTLMCQHYKDSEGKEYAAAFLHPAAYLFIDVKLKTTKYKPGLATLHLKAPTLKVILISLSSHFGPRLSSRVVTFY